MSEDRINGSQLREELNSLGTVLRSLFARQDRETSPYVADPSHEMMHGRQAGLRLLSGVHGKALSDKSIGKPMAPSR